MKSRLIVNPVSGTDAGPDHLPLINQRLRERLGTLDIVMTTGEGDATQAAAQAVRDGYDYVFAGGGDGTLNEVLNGIASVPNGLAQTVIGVIPLGTGNDLATALGFPDDIAAVLDAIDVSSPIAVDVGVMNGHHFINVSAGGFIAEVSDAVGTQLKSIAGRLAYLIGGAQVLFTHEAVTATVSWTGPGAASSARFDLHAFAVCNSRQIGGGRLIAPDAVIDDGVLDVCLIEAMPLADFVALLRRVSNGDHIEDERVRYFRAASAHLAFDRTVKVNTDGQVLDAARCEYRVLPRAARLVSMR
ncbi:MAG TPA: diacylglycerol kinase family protein [Vicinamibacterales bacterium]|nr:diacylglycerol kinase family protein [Vicinamibacterales bacterium]